jgi:hypothetical protein
MSAVDAGQRAALLRIVGVLIDDGHGDLDRSFRGAATSAPSRERVEAAFELRDALEWGEPERESYSLRLSPHTRRVVAEMRDDLEHAIGEERAVLLAVRAGELGYVGMGFDESERHAHQRIDRMLEEWQALNAVLAIPG